MTRDDLLSPKEAAPVLRIGLNAAYALFRRPDFPAISMCPKGKKRVIRRAALEAWIADRESAEVEARTRGNR